MKTGKEVKTNKFKEYSVVFGSVNNKNPKAVYINISAWAAPKENDDVSYLRVIRNINKLIKQQTYNLLSTDITSKFVKERTIVDLDIRESGIKFGKRSFMNCELTLFLEEEISVNTEFMQGKLEWITEDIIKNVFEKDETFEFHKRKK
jgi:hypothetical protein